MSGAPGIRPRPLKARAFRIRRATLEDRAVCVRMAVRFIAEGSYRGVLVPNLGQLEALVQYLVEHGAIFVSQDDTGAVVGMIGAQVVVHPISGELTAAEVALWVEPEHRGRSMAVRLVDAAEAWALQNGAVWMQMIAPAGNPAVGDLYRRRGYLPLETTFQKDLRASAARTRKG